MKTLVITFPGSNCDKDIGYVLEKYYNHKVTYLWHKEQFNNEYDLVVLPGGFSYGDYLRCGALARFAVAMSSLQSHIQSGKMVLGICNGFQILVEAGLLPGALTLNKTMKHICKDVLLIKGSSNNKCTQKLAPDKILNIPISHGEGCYYAPDDVLQQLEDENRIMYKYYKDNPNGSINNIAGITSKDFKIQGLMPHPERAMEPLTNSMDGKIFFDSLFD